MDLEEPIRKIKTPTLGARRSRRCRDTTLVRGADPRRIAGSKYLLIPNAAHITNVEQVALFNKEVMGFLGTP